MRSIATAARRLTARPDARLVAANFTGVALGLVSAALQARALGPTGRGEIAIAIAPATVIAILMGFGLPDYFGRRSAQGADRHVSASVAAVLALVSALVCAVPYVLFVDFQTDPGTASRVLLVVYAAVSPVIVYGTCTGAVAAGHGAWRGVVLSRFVPQLVTVAGLLALTVAGPSPLNVGLLLVATTLFGSLLPGVLGRVLPTAAPTVAEARAAVRFGLRGWPAGSVALLNQRVDLLLLSVLATPYDLGLYAVATTLAATLNGVAVSIAIPLRNRIVRGEHDVVPGASTAVLAILLACGAVLAVSLPVLIPLVLGTGFLPAQPAMVVLLLAQAPLGAVIVLTQALIALGRPGAPLVGEALALVVTVTLVLATYRQHGIVAAALANLAGNLVSWAVLVHLVRRHVTRAPLRAFLLPSRRSIAALKEA
ncbi:oligosaccharide flippase family protein [Cellulomonas septica]|uniref:Oligosaccharide flippase family protein n=1 Tax=Cellulomonas septica TaxID=285080 RepID=A0ABX1K070_9CELL|nr:oligosaccharide flippase family protein [Cellulomonas septica]